MIPTQADFDYARAHPEARPAFIRVIELYDKAELIADIVYKQRKKRPAYAAYLDSTMRAAFMTAHPVHCGQTIITVHASAFESPEKIETIDDFMSALVDHEYTHAEQNGTEMIHRERTATTVCKLSTIKHMIARENWSLDAMEAIADTSQRYLLIITGMVEVPAYERQLDGRFSGRISAALRRRVEKNLSTYRNNRYIVMKATGMDSQDILTYPGEFYTAMHKNRHTIDCLVRETMTENASERTDRA